MSEPKRGIRNHNPGNVRVGENWQGLAARHEMTPEQKKEREFCVFRAPEWGIRAIVVILQTYRRKYGINTIGGVVGKWAPSIENDTAAYIAHVATELGTSPTTPLDTTDPEILAPLVKAIIQHENGTQPYSDATIRAGIALADLRAPKPKPVLQSKRLQGGAIIAGVTTAMTQSRQAIETAKEIVGAVSPEVAASGNLIGVAAIVGTALAGFALYIGWTIFADYRDRSEVLNPER